MSSVVQASKVLHLNPVHTWAQYERMTDAARGNVRPTKRCLDDLHLSFPPYTESLASLPHPVIRKAQAVPSEVAAGGSQRVRSLSDRVWFKVKIKTFRAAATRLTKKEATRLGLPFPLGEWWIGAAGTREEGSLDDFYESIAGEARRQGKGSGTVDTSVLLPTSIDRKRLDAELAALAVVSIQTLACRIIVMSLRHGKPFSAEFSGCRVTAYVQAESREDAYLAMSAEGIRNPAFIATILAAVPGVPPTDWMIEPTEVLGIHPEPGQLIWSTMISPQVQANLLDSFAEED